MLGVICVYDTRDQRLLALRLGSLVRSEFRAGRIQIASFKPIGRVGPEACVLRAKAGAVVVVSARAQRQNDSLDVRSIITQILPSFSIGIVGKLVIDLSVIRWRVDIGDVVAEIKEILARSFGAPINFLPGARGVHEWTSNGEGNCLGKVSDIFQIAETEYVFQFLYGIILLRVDERVHLVDNIVDAGNAVLRRQQLDRVIPLGIVELTMDHAAARDSSIERVAILLDRKRRQRARVAAAIGDPGSTGRIDIINARQLYISSECFVVGNNLFRAKVYYFVGGRGVVRRAHAVITVFQNNADAVELPGELRYEAGIEMRITINWPFSGQVKKDRTARLIMGGIHKIALFEGSLGMGRILRVVREMVNLALISDTDGELHRECEIFKNIQLDQNSTPYG